MARFFDNCRYCCLPVLPQGCRRAGEAVERRHTSTRKVKAVLYRYHSSSTCSTFSIILGWVVTALKMAARGRAIYRVVAKCGTIHSYRNRILCDRLCTPVAREARSVLEAENFKIYFCDRVSRGVRFQQV